jgi:hypothetical protein
MNCEIIKPRALNKILMLRINPDVLTYIEMCAEKQGISKSLVARQLLEIGKKHYKIKKIINEYNTCWCR